MAESESASDADRNAEARPMSTFEVNCERCPFSDEAASIAEALKKEEEHKRQHGAEHRVTIKRLS